jgi:hypothetical protein
MEALFPCLRQTARALAIASDVLGGVDSCVYRNGAYNFFLDGGRSIRITPESAERFRIDSCTDGATRATTWALAGDEGRIAFLVAEAAQDGDAVRPAV